MINFYTQNNNFMEFDSNFDDSDICILGVPFDGTETYRSGARFGPRSIREASLSIESYSRDLDLELNDLRICDCGDLIVSSNAKETLKRIEEIIPGIVDKDKFPVLIGGEHLISLGAIKGLKAKYKDLRVVGFDAHLDLRDEYSGEQYSHSTVMLRIFEMVEEVYQVGIRSGSKHEFEFAQENTKSYGADNIKEAVSDIMKDIGTAETYLTFDIDVLDPAYAPGTSNPEPCGISPAELINAIHEMKGLEVVGFDLVEVCPVYDQSGITAVTAAKIIREGILSFFG